MALRGGKKSMKKNAILPAGFSGCMAALFIVLLAVAAMIISVKYHQYTHPACARSSAASLGGGFPFLLICDDWGGGSPTASWDKIGWVDVLYGGVKPLGFLANLLVYMSLFWLPYTLIRHLFSRRRSNQPSLN